MTNCRYGKVENVAFIMANVNVDKCKCVDKGKLNMTKLTHQDVISFMFELSSSIHDSH